MGMDLGLRKLVGSPDGLKHRLLAQASPGEISRGISQAADEMAGYGIATFLDFREQGPEGIRIFRNAGVRIRGLAFGRPLSQGILEQEISKIIQMADGIGLDRAGIYDDESLSSIRSASSGKDIAIHVSEARRKRGEVERVVDVLSADILVHLTHAQGDDLRLIADRGCRAVVCPLANLHVGTGFPPLDLIIDGIEAVGIGTDNLMINSSNLFREMELAHALTKRKRARDILKMATISGARALGIDGETGSLEVGKTADIIALAPGRNLQGVKDIHAAVVKRANPQDIALVLSEGRPVYDGRSV
jgi:cytosine/adenosine deaminase-related metal-dependent hydrolase